MTSPTVAREHLLDTHRDLLKAVLACAECVAESWEGNETIDRATVVEPFGRALDRAGIRQRLPAMLVTAVDAIGETLSAEPVAAPPYVAITSRGPVLRATLESGRLVVTIRVFDVERDPTRYVRGATTVEDALGVELRNR